MEPDIPPGSIARIHVKTLAQCANLTVFSDALAEQLLGCIERQLDRIAARRWVDDRHRGHFVDTVSADTERCQLVRYAEFFAQLQDIIVEAVEATGNAEMAAASPILPSIAGRLKRSTGGITTALVMPWWVL